MTDDRLADLGYISDQYYLSENITQQVALEKAIFYFIKRATRDEKPDESDLEED